MTTSAHLAYVYDGRRSIGHLLARGRAGIEAFDVRDRSLGIYPDQRAAADAITVALLAAEVEANALRSS